MSEGKLGAGSGDIRDTARIHLGAHHQGPRIHADGRELGNDRKDEVVRRPQAVCNCLLSLGLIRINPHRGD